jgi:hypothetical protein
MMRQPFRNITTILSGGAPGPDLYGEAFAEINTLKLERYPADWEHKGKIAGAIRNKQMAENADALIAIWDGKSKGTKNMIDLALRNGLSIYVEVIK